MEPESNPLDLLKQRRAINRVEAAMRKTEETPKPGGYRYLGRNADTGQGLIVGNDGSVIPGDIIASGYIKPGQAVRVAQAGGLVQLDQKPRVRKVVPPVVKKEELGNIKVLYSVVEGSEKVFYVGGDRATPSRVIAISPESTPGLPTPFLGGYISNTGRGASNFQGAVVRDYGNAYPDWSIFNLRTQDKADILGEPYTYTGPPQPPIPPHKIGLFWVGGGFFVSSSVRTVPVQAGDDNSFLTAWGGSGGGSTSLVSNSFGSTYERSYGYTAPSRHYAFDLREGGLQIKYGSLSYSYYYYQDQPNPSGMAGGSFLRLLTASETRSDISTTFLGNELEGEYFVDSFSFEEGGRDASAPISRDILRYDQLTLKGSAGSLIRRRNNGADQYFYKTGAGEVAIPGADLSDPRNIGTTVTNYASNRINLIGDSIYFVGWTSSGLLDLDPLPSTTRQLKITQMRLDGSGDRRETQAKIFPLPEDPTMQIHSVSYHP